MNENVCPFCETEGEAEFMHEYIGEIAVKKRPCGSLFQTFPVYTEKHRGKMCLRIESLNQRIEHLEMQLQSDT